MWAGRIPLEVCRFNKRGDVNDIVMASIFGVFVIFFFLFKADRHLRDHNLQGV